MSIIMSPGGVSTLENRRMSWNGLKSSISSQLSKAETDASRIMMSLWNQLHVDVKYQEYFESAKIGSGNISLGEIEEEIACIEEALGPVPMKRWPSSPSERFREVQMLLSNLEKFWGFYRISEEHRENFKATHKNLDNLTLGRIWEQHEIYRKLTLRERSRLSEQEQKTAMKQIAEAIHQQRSILGRFWAEMKVPAEVVCGLYKVEIRAEHLNPETIELHEVKAIVGLHSFSASTGRMHTWGGGTFVEALSRLSALALISDWGQN